MITTLCTLMKNVFSGENRVYVNALTKYPCNYLLEIRDSQNLAKLGLGAQLI